MQVQGVGAPRPGHDRKTDEHAHECVQVCKCIERNEKKNEDGRRTGPFKRSKTNYEINDVHKFCECRIVSARKQMFLPVRNVSTERSESYG